ncbi:MAG: hypothetical protein H6623_06010 [Bdellovibrionaceae bacterium]|nr:hypothetical protein [Pseudobdellovibrionaceae bacterium]
MIKKTMFLMVLLFFSFAQAKEVSLGEMNSSQNKENVKLSIQMQNNGGALLRYRPESYEIKCSLYRKDFCGIEHKVKLIEASLSAKNVTFISSSLAHFEFFDFIGSVKAILEDGSEISISSPGGSLDVFTETSLAFISTGKFAPKTFTRISMQLWGNRADGLDPLVQNSIEKGLFVYEPSYEEVSTSLF